MFGKGKQKTEQIKKKRSYVCPELTCFGEVKNLTAEGSSFGFEQPTPEGPMGMEMPMG
jgi:hypothetical protein